MLFKSNLFEGLRAGISANPDAPKTGFAYLAQLLAQKKAEMA